MKQRQYIAIFSLMVALTGLTPVVAANESSTSTRHRYQTVQDRNNDSNIKMRLTEIQLDKTRGGIYISPTMAHAIEMAMHRAIYNKAFNIDNNWPCGHC